MTRATWADFVRWFADEKCIWEHQTARMHRCAHIVRSLGEVHVALASIYDLAPRQLDTLVAAWLASLRERGIEPPEDSSWASDTVVLGLAEDVPGQWVAHHLQRDLVTQGNSLTHALRMMAETIETVDGIELPEEPPTATSVLEEVVKEFDRRACDGCPSPECRAEAKAMRQAAATIRARAKELT